ncbi:M50 family metallopeptidase [archaeon]
MNSFLFFPGMMLHEIAHAVACVLLGVDMTKIKLWGKSGASVTHRPTTGWKNFVVAIAPFFLNTLLAVVALWVGHIALMKTAFFVPGKIGYILLFYWLGASFAYFAFPSETDLKSGWKVLWRHYKSRLLLQKGVVSTLLHWLTLPLLIPARIVLGLMGFMNQPRAGTAWAVVLFLFTALVAGV